MSSKYFPRPNFSKKGDSVLLERSTDMNEKKAMKGQLLSIKANLMGQKDDSVMMLIKLEEILEKAEQTKCVVSALYDAMSYGPNTPDTYTEALSLIQEILREQCLKLLDAMNFENERRNEGSKENVN